jgi:hypothetical protein
MTFPFRWHDLITPWVAVHKQIATKRLRLLKAKKTVGVALADVVCVDRSPPKAPH